MFQSKIFGCTPWPPLLKSGIAYSNGWGDKGHQILITHALWEIQELSLPFVDGNGAYQTFPTFLQGVPLSDFGLIGGSMFINLKDQCSFQKSCMLGGLQILVVC